MIKRSREFAGLCGTGAYLVVLGLLVLTFAGRASDARDLPANVAVTNLANICQPDALRAVASQLSVKVTIQEVPKEEIPNGRPFTDGTNFTAASAKLPAYCQVTGSFVTNPATGKTANFLATFPAEWNRKFLQMGCSGHCGQFIVSNAASPVVTITNQGYPFESITKGYASFATDEGHVGATGGTWAVKGPGQVDEEAIEDFYYRADKVLARMGKEFTKAFYSAATGKPQKIVRAYFCGCSGGGRDAFVAASYFPEEFDGIIGGSAYNAAGGAFQMAGIPLASIRSDDAALPPALVSQIDPIVKAKCDALDGVEDGLIQNPAACDFLPERDLPHCADDKPGPQCFTTAQIQTVSVVLSAVTDENGNVVQPGYSVSEMRSDTFATPPRPMDLATKDPWPNSDNGLQGQGQGGGYWPLADAFLKVFIHKNDPDFFTRTLVTFQDAGPESVRGYHIVVPQSEVALVRSNASMTMGHVPENAARLIKLNRKFLIWNNYSDQTLSPYVSVNYYKSVARLFGGYTKVQKNIRLFMLPGTSHCSMGGAGPAHFDAISAMENWVEKSKAPDSLMASVYDPRSPMVDPAKTPLRTMPLCKFPEMAHYSGHGDVRAAVNWSCPSSDTSMLKIGESGKRAGIVP